MRLIARGRPPVPLILAVAIIIALISEVSARSFIPIQFDISSATSFLRRGASFIAKSRNGTMLSELSFNISDVRSKLENISSKAQSEIVLPFTKRVGETRDRTWQAVMDLPNSTFARGIRRRIPPRNVWNKALFRRRTSNSAKNQDDYGDGQDNPPQQSTGVLLLEYVNDWIPAVTVPTNIYDKVKETIANVTEVYNHIVNSDSPAVAATSTLISGTRMLALGVVDLVRDFYSLASDVPAEDARDDNGSRTFHNISEIVEALVEFAMSYDDLTNTSWKLVSDSHGLEIWRIDRPPRPQGGVSTWPSFRFSARLDAPPDRVLSLIFDSAKAHSVNRYSLGRTDVEIMDSNTKIVWNRIADVTGVRRPHDFSTLMHIHRPLNSSDIVIVSVAIDHPEVPETNDFTRSKIIFGFSRLRGVRSQSHNSTSTTGLGPEGNDINIDSNITTKEHGFDATELVSVSHVQFEGFHPFIISRSSSIGIRSYVDQLKWAIIDHDLRDI